MDRWESLIAWMGGVASFLVGRCSIPQTNMSILTSIYQYPCQPAHPAGRRRLRDQGGQQGTVLTCDPRTHLHTCTPSDTPAYTHTHALSHMHPPPHVHSYMSNLSCVSFKVRCIAAASILAKVTRDRIMVRLSRDMDRRRDLRWMLKLACTLEFF